MRPVPKNYITDAFMADGDRTKFFQGMQTAINEIRPDGVFAADNIFTFGRNLSFLEDEKFMTACSKHADTLNERAVIWRTYVLAWAAKRALRLNGDFVECGCYKGTTARILCDYIDLGSLKKDFYLYDLFEHASSMDHHSMPEHSSDLCHQVTKRFSDLPNVKVTQGTVPESFETLAPPGDIAFLHIDMNNAAAELGALEHLYDQVVPGAVIIFDDYGWLIYRKQKLAEDAFFADLGMSVLELPTGQGLVFK